MEIGFPTSGPTIINADNQGCISMTKNNRTDDLTKHIDMKYHYIREQVEANKIAVHYCATNFMVADFLTKPINTRKFQWCRDKLG
jgi:hypothetical protein